MADLPPAEFPELVTDTFSDPATSGTTNPVLAGFYPDPSICRVADTYYLVTSTFEYLPGVPVHTSTDLVHWSPLGHVLTRPSQIAEHEGHPSSGVYAPTIRHHEGRFWVIGTNVLDLPSGRGHFIVHAERAQGPWSDPVFVSGVMGIDPDIVWDETGTCHVTWTSFDPTCPGIVSAPVEPTTGALLSSPRPLWQGSGLSATEGPHLYRIDGWWYLLLAEGGTERGHAVTIARARTLEGPFEAAPHNPVLSHRSTSSPVQNVGHADLVELVDGSWAAVHLGVQPRGQTPGFHVNGRETFLVGIDWIDGWPTVDEHRFAIGLHDHSFVDTFSGPRLDDRWIGIGRFPQSFTELRSQGGVEIVAPPDDAPPSLLAARARDSQWRATVRLEAGDGEGRFVVRLDERHQYGLHFTADDVAAFLMIGPVTQTTEAIPRPTGDLILEISASTAPQRMYGGTDEPDLIELAVVLPGGQRAVLRAADGRYVSTEVAGGFTGRVWGVEALRGTVTARQVQYETR